MEFRICRKATGAQIGVEALPDEQRVAAFLDAVVVPDGNVAVEHEEAGDDTVMPVRRNCLAKAKDQDVGADAKPAQQAEAPAPDIEAPGRPRIFATLIQA